MVRAVLSILLLALASVAHAQTHSVGGGCKPLQLHTPDDDVHVRDGVGAGGWAVAPADLVPPAITKESFDPVGIALDVPLADYIDRDDYNFNPSETEIWLGRVNVDMDGRVDFNRQPLNDPSYIDPDCVPKEKK